jgi:predicted deacylase
MRRGFVQPRLRQSMFCVLLFVLQAFASGEDSAPVGKDAAAGILGEKTAWATPWYVVEGTEPGPVVFLTGGVHGNEPAGSRAAEQIRHWPIRRGRLIVVPKVNMLGLAVKTRWFPPLSEDAAQRDLNRNFPTSDRELPQSPVAEALWELVDQQKPDFVIDLHEGFDFHRSNANSVGSSIIFSKSDKRIALAEKMVAAVNATVENPQRKFELLSRSGAAKGSLVRACTDRLKIDSFILETTYKEQPLSLRTRQHRRMVSTLLQGIGLIDRDCVDVLGHE